MNYKISVIVATYNSGDFLNEFLDSIKSQSLGFEDIEVIFVDDASTDDYTLDLLNNFNESYPNVSVIFLDENSGFPGTGRNRGLDLAGGEYVIFADPVSYTHLDVYKRQVLIHLFFYPPSMIDLFGLSRLCLHLCILVWC